MFLRVGKYLHGMDYPCVKEGCSLVSQNGIESLHKDIPAYYSLMDVFVRSSMRDGIPNALLEAMACGRAVIATRLGGTLDVLDNNKNGMTVNVNDATMLADKTLKLLDDPEKRVRLGKNARDVIMERFAPEKELEENLNVYRKPGLKV